MPRTTPGLMAPGNHVETALRALRRRVVEAGMQVDVTIAEVKLVPPRWLIKSSAGKLSRGANRERLLAAAADDRSQET